MNVRSHNAEVESFFDILSGCYAHLIYNDLYGKAVEIAMDDGNTSATDAFRNILTQYSRGTDNSERCVQLLQYINKYHNRHHNYIGVVDLEKRFIRTFWPGDTEQLSKSQRNSAVANILRKTIRNAIGVALEPEQVRSIIDRHSSQASMEALQDRIVGCCFLVRESYHTRFARKESGVGEDDNVPGEVVAKLTKRLNAALDKNKTLESELEASKRIMRLLAIRTKEAEAAIEQRDVEIAELRRGQVRAAAGTGARTNTDTSVRANTDTSAFAPRSANTSASASRSANTSASASRSASTSASASRSASTNGTRLASASPSSLPFNRIVQSPPAAEPTHEKLGFSPMVRSPAGSVASSTAPTRTRGGKKGATAVSAGDKNVTGSKNATGNKNATGDKNNTDRMNDEEAEGLTAPAETVEDVRADVEQYLMSPHMDDDEEFIGSMTLDSDDEAPQRKNASVRANISASTKPVNASGSAGTSANAIMEYDYDDDIADDRDSNGKSLDAAIDGVIEGATSKNYFSTVINDDY